ncbi:hypothetical protein [Hymenobacter volaticus]|uniref:DUF1292 domain-containing protein n=1 Tax=Hymenobacter volaticus TaxID=2932254 RepID=A0ABY4G2B5_9BACT|nr:hypothetical protein [Hymenobacter volaticus]UOQ64997.1 hypothetical protein MUN86_15680 [Hymenobacter volaticus]
MSLDSASFFQYTPETEKTTIYVQTPDGEDMEPCDALLVAQTKQQKLYITLESKRRYLLYTQLPDSDEMEMEFLQDYEEVEALMEDAGLDGIHDGEQGIVYHNLLFLLMNPY